MNNIQKITQYTIKKVAEAQGPNDQEENALWADFYDCLQEAAKAEHERSGYGLDIHDLSQEMIEANKAK